jgi:hypothetical protein
MEGKNISDDMELAMNTLSMIDFQNISHASKCDKAIQQLKKIRRDFGPRHYYKIMIAEFLRLAYTRITAIQLNIIQHHVIFDRGDVCQDLLLILTDIVVQLKKKEDL